MLRKRKNDHTMAGQVLFASLSGGSLILDCILARGDHAGVPVTLKARLPRGGAATVAKLDQWIEEGSVVEIAIASGAGGNELAISRSTKRVVLDREF